jgi:Zn-dependent protease
MNFASLLLLAPPILIALTFHEYAHAYAAYRRGDDTARQLGRLSLNPLRHLDPFGTLMIFLVHFGWAKPVPVNPSRLKNPRKDMLWIAAAGPLSNMVLALVSGLLLRMIFSIEGMPDVQTGRPIGPVSFMVMMSLQINLALAIFNILPIAPLDGSKILSGILPAGFAGFIGWLERYGPFILIGLIIIGRTTDVSILGGLIWPFVDIFSRAFAGI